MPTLSKNDPEPEGRSGPRLWIVALLVALVLAVVALHLTGVAGPG